MGLGLVAAALHKHGGTCVSCGTCKQYASPLRCCGTPKLHVCQGAVKFASCDKFDAQFDLKVLDPQVG